MVAIIIVLYNSKRFLKDLLLSIQNSTYKNYKLIFIDNNSTDDSAEFLTKNYPWVILIKNKKNYGFPKAANQGIEKALKLKAEYIFLLNPDTILHKNCLSELIKAADPNTIFQPLILLFNKKKTNLINSAGNVLHYLGFAYRGDFKKPASLFQKKKEIPVASGAAIFLPAKIIKRIGYLNETFFLYHEETDFSLRARLAGYKIKLLPTAKIWHHYSFSATNRNIFFIERNRFLVLFINLQPKTILLIAPMLCINEILSILLFPFLGYPFIKLKVIFSIIKLIPEISRKRKLVNIIRKKKDSEIKQFFSTEIDFPNFPLPFLKTLYQSLLSIYWRMIYKLI